MGNCCRAESGLGPPYSPPARVFLFVGATRSGKTTLLKHLQLSSSQISTQVRDHVMAHTISQSLLGSIEAWALEILLRCSYPMKPHFEGVLAALDIGGICLELMQELQKVSNECKKGVPAMRCPHMNWSIGGQPFENVLRLVETITQRDDDYRPTDEDILLYHWPSSGCVQHDFHMHHIDEPKTSTENNESSIEMNSLTAGHSQQIMQQNNNNNNNNSGNKNKRLHTVSQQQEKEHAHPVHVRLIDTSGFLLDSPSQLARLEIDPSITGLIFVFGMDGIVNPPQAPVQPTSPRSSAPASPTPVDINNLSPFVALRDIQERGEEKRQSGQFFQNSIDQLARVIKHPRFQNCADTLVIVNQMSVIRKLISSGDIHLLRHALCYQGPPELRDVEHFITSQVHTVAPNTTVLLCDALEHVGENSPFLSYIERVACPTALKT